MARNALSGLVQRHAEALPLDQPRDPEAIEKFFIRAAFHDAGHAVVGRHLDGAFPDPVTIESGSTGPSKHPWGIVRWGPRLSPDAIQQMLPTMDSEARRLAREDAERWAQIDLAGYAVDDVRYFNEPPIDLSELQWEKDADVLGALLLLAPFTLSKAEQWRSLRRLWEHTKTLVKRVEIMTHVERFAEALLDTPTLDRDEVVHLLTGVKLQSRQP